MYGFGGRSLATASFTCGFSVSNLSVGCWCDGAAHLQSLARGPPVKVDFILNGKMLSGNLKLKLPE